MLMDKCYPSRAHPAAGRLLRFAVAAWLLSPSLLPAAIQKTLSINYKAAKITEAAKIVTAATGATTYEAEISQGGQHHDVLFHADGTEVVKK